MYIMNKVWEIGRLTKEPEIRYISKKNGKGEEESTVTASYTLAVARGYEPFILDVCVGILKNLQWFVCLGSALTKPIG